MCKLIIPNMFKLMMPTDELIQQYNDFWNKKPDQICDSGWKVKLFEYGEWR